MMPLANFMFSLSLLSGAKQTMSETMMQCFIDLLWELSQDNQ